MFNFHQIAMTGVTVGFVIGRATSTKQSPVYKAVMELDTGKESLIKLNFLESKGK